MRGFTKNSSSFLHFGEDAQSKFRFVFGMFVLSIFIVFSTVTAAMGYGTTEALVNKLQTEQTETQETTESQITEVQDESATLAETQFKINSEISNPNYVSTYPVNFSYTGQTTRTSTIHYGYLDTEDNFVDIPAFQTASVEKDYSRLTASGQGYIFQDGGAQATTATDFQWSHWDVRYYEETFTYDGHTYAFCDCYLGSDATASNAVQLTKLTYARYGNNYGWFYRNDLGSETSAAPWHLYSAAGQNATDVWVVFKDVTRSGRTEALNQVDFEATWSTAQGDVQGTAYCQYCYTDASQDLTTANYYKLDPPFAGDLNLEYQGRQQDASPMTFKNYCGRYVRQVEPGIGTYDCTYYTTFIYLYPGQGGEPEYHSATRLTCANSNWYYDNGSGTWTVLGSASTPVCVSITYDYSYKSVTPTVDSASQNITINCFDYDGWRDITATQSGNRQPYRYNNAINTYSDFKFSSARNGNGGEVEDWEDHGGTQRNINRTVTGGSGLDLYCRRGIWANTLGTNGYPQLKEASVWNKSNLDLSYLFIESNNPYKRDYRNLNHLFYQSTYDTRGYYYFDSGGMAGLDAGHFAQLRKKADNVGSATGEGTDCYDTGSDFVLFTEPSTDEVKFGPWNDKDNAVADNRNMLFGMQILTNFIQPKNGQIQWGTRPLEDMTFQFRGDDDVFLYIDGVLVLDLGGIHGICQGDVNFATGVVNRASDTTTGRTEDVDLYQMYVDAGKADSVEWVPSPQTGKNIFKDYSSHTFAFYYFERGEGYSDCYCAFNLPTIPEGAIEVGKTVDAPADVHAQTEGKFYYKAQQWVEDSSYEAGGYWIDYDGDYNVYSGRVGEHTSEIIATRHAERITLGKRGTTVNGVVWIEDGQVAQLTGFDDGTKFRVVEFDPRDVDVGIKWVVYLNDEQHPASKIDIPDEGSWYGQDEGLVAGQTAGVQFINVVNEENLVEARVHKIGQDNMPTDIKIYLDGVVEGDNPPSQTKLFEGTYLLQDPDGTRTERTTGQGGVISLMDGYTVVIEKVQLDTLVTVEAIDLAPKTIAYSVIAYDYDNYQEGSMIEAYDDFNVTYAANMPPEFPQSWTGEKYGQINFEVVNPSNTLMLAKDTEGAYADKTKKFEMSLSLYNPDGTIFVPTESTFTGKLYRVSGTEATLDIIAMVNASGEVMISENTETPAWKYPDLANGDYIVVYSILPPNGGYVLGWEEKNEMYVQTFYHVTADPETGIEVFSAYEPASGTEGKEYISTNPDSLISLITDGEGQTITNSFYMKNLNDSPPTGFDIFMNPDLWIFILAVLLTLIVAGPLKVISVRRRRKKLFSPDNDVFNDDIFIKEGFIC